MKTIIASTLIAMFSVSCMTAKDKEIFAEVFPKEAKSEAISESNQEVKKSLEILPTKLEDKEKKAEAKPVEVN